MMPPVDHAQRRYAASRLTKGTASLDEVRALLLNWRPDEAAADFAARVLQEGILSKQTARRVQDLVNRMFREWFLVPNDSAARQLKVLVNAGVDRRSLNELVFLYKARSEPVLYDFTVERFWPACRAGELYLRTAEIEDFLREAQDAGRAAQHWSPETRERLAQGILRALSDVGFLRQERRYFREYVVYRVTDLTVAYLAYELHSMGLSDAALVEHADWSLFGLTRREVLERLGELGESASLIIQHAGSVVRITWLYATMDEVVHAQT